jgi:hypothetical protein
MCKSPDYTRGLRGLLTRLRFREGVAIESGVSASDCCCGSGTSLRWRRLRLLEGGMGAVVCVYCLERVEVSDCVDVEYTCGV